MENSVWLAIAVSVSLAIFLIWVLRGDRQGASSCLGSGESADLLVETESAPPSIGGAQPPA